MFDPFEKQILRVGQTLLQLGEMHGESLQPAENLQARIVTIKAEFKCRVSPFEFGVALGKQIARKGIETMPMLGDRKSLRIKGLDIVGYAVRFEGLKPIESMILQTEGLGGRRKMGCGFFYG